MADTYLNTPGSVTRFLGYNSMPYQDWVNNARLGYASNQPQQSEVTNSPAWLQQIMNMQSDVYSPMSSPSNLANAVQQIGGDSAIGFDPEATRLQLQKQFQRLGLANAMTIDANGNISVPNLNYDDPGHAFGLTFGGSDGDNIANLAKVMASVVGGMAGGGAGGESSAPAGYGDAGYSGAAANGGYGSMDYGNWGVDSGSSSSASYGGGTTVSGGGGGGGSGGGGNMGDDGYFDDFTGEWVNGSPPATDAGGGDFTFPGETTNSGVGTYPNGSMSSSGVTDPGLWDQITNYAKQFGLTPESLAKSLGPDLLKRLIDGGAQAALGTYAADKQADAFSQLANQFASYGAPYRQRLADLYANPSSFLSSPEVTAPLQQAATINARALSRNGNPVDSGNAQQALNDFTANQLFSRLGEEKNRLATFGGIGPQNLQTTASATGNAIASDTAGYNAIGAELANIFSPPQTWAQQMADFYRLSGAHP